MDPAEKSSTRNKMLLHGRNAQPQLEQLVLDLPTPEGWKAELALDCVFRAVIESSFRRAELTPVVRRFIQICHQMSLASTVAERVAEFPGLLTDSLHAWVVVLAVSRRAGYGPRESGQLAEALLEVSLYFLSQMVAENISKRIRLQT